MLVECELFELRFCSSRICMGGVTGVLFITSKVKSTMSFSVAMSSTSLRKQRRSPTARSQLCSGLHISEGSYGTIFGSFPPQRRPYSGYGSCEEGCGTFQHHAATLSEVCLSRGLRLSAAWSPRACSLPGMLQSRPLSSSARLCYARMHAGIAYSVMR